MFLKLRVWWMLRRDHSLHGRIVAVRFVHNKTGWALKWSKAYVDEIADGM